MAFQSFQYQLTFTKIFVDISAYESEFCNAGENKETEVKKNSKIQEFLPKVSSLKVSLLVMSFPSPRNVYRIQLLYGIILIPLSLLIPLTSD